MLAANPAPVPPPVPGDTHTPPPAGFVAAWTPMPQLTGGGYEVVPGVYYRAAVSLTGFGVGLVATHARITAGLVGAGFNANTLGVWSSTSDNGFPSDWSPPDADRYAQGQYIGAPQKFPVSKCGTGAFSGYCGDVVEAWVYWYQPIGAPPPKVQPNQIAKPSSTGTLVGWGIGIASLAGLGWYFRKPILAKLKSIKM